MSGKSLDLDAVRKARQEEAGEPPTVTLCGRDFVLPLSLPGKVLVGLSAAKSGDAAGFVDVFTGLFGAEADAALDLGLDVDDVAAIIEHIYGDNPGEASGSAT